MRCKITNRLFCLVVFTSAMCLRFEKNLFDWIDSGNVATFAMIGVCVNVSVRFDGEAVNGRADLELAEDVIFSQHVVGDVLWKSGLVLERHREQLVMNSRPIDGLFNRFAEP